MPELPTFQDLYDLFADHVRDDPETLLNDFSDGSLLDAFAGVSAMAGRSIQRWVARQVRRKFFDTAPPEDLERIAVDYFGDDVARKDGESIEAYQDRVEQYRAHALYRGTPPALRYYTSNLEGALNVAVEEDYVAGKTTLKVAVDTDAVTLSDFRDAWSAEVDEWRSDGSPAELDLYEDSLP